MRASLVGVALALTSVPAWAQIDIVEVSPVLETPNLPDNEFESDGDDPAIWVDPADASRTLIVTAVKNGGLRVYGLDGALIQTVNPAPAAEGIQRFNNVDIAYGVALADGSTIDIAVATDRGQDVIRIWRIDNTNPSLPLTEITATETRAFPMRPDPAGGADLDNPLDDQHTAYGLALWQDRDAGKLFAIVTQRTDARLAQFELTPTADGRIAASFVRDWRYAYVHAGQDLTIESDDDSLQDWSPQFEGLVVDQETGRLYAGQEDVGIWRIDLKTGEAEDAPFYETRGAATSSFARPESVVARDVEGLTIYYGPNGTGYLLASSQGGAHGDAPAPDAPYDDSFAVFAREGDNAYLGSFRIVATAGGIDAVQECDGGQVWSQALPGFPSGLLVVQDGYNDDELDGDPEASNFKLVPWENVARAFDAPLMITPEAFDPRQ